MELTGQDMHKAYGKVFPSMFQSHLSPIHPFHDIAAEINKIIEEKQFTCQVCGEVLNPPDADTHTCQSYKVRPDWLELQRRLGE